MYWGRGCGTANTRWGWMRRRRGRLIFITALLTGIGVFDSFAKHAGAGTLVPITGFANAVVAPAMEFRQEGFVTGTAVKLFTVAGPVLVFGISASVIYGLVYWVWTLI